MLANIPGRGDLCKGVESRGALIYLGLTVTLPPTIHGDVCGLNLRKNVTTSKSRVGIRYRSGLQRFHPDWTS